DPNFVNSDLHQFDVHFGLPDPPSFTKVNQSGLNNQSGQNNLPAPAPANWAQEIALDVEYAHAVAPGANILLVEANDNYSSNWDTAVKYASSQPGVVVVSMSVLYAEESGQTTRDAYFDHAGVTYVACSGDAGAPGTYPAFSPNVVAVGGTTLD